jgi:hypothetical protein
MHVLDKSFFRKVVPLAAASISDVKQITNVRKDLDRSGDILKISPIKHLREDDSAPGAKCILLRHGIEADGTFGLLELSDPSLTREQNRVRGRPHSPNWWKTISPEYDRTT